MGHHVYLRLWIEIGKPQCAVGNCENIPAGFLVQNVELMDEGRGLAVEQRAVDTAAIVSRWRP